MDPNRVLIATASAIVETAGGLDADALPVSVSDADPRVAAEWAPLVRAAIPALRRFSRKLDALAAPVTVTGTASCQHCGRSVTPPPSGRAVMYCSQSCRQRAYEARKAAR